MLGDDGRVVLMDFGAGGDLRHAGLDMAGTPLYLAPEVARGAPASPQSDIYSLGVLLRYAATGAYSRDVVPGSKDKALKRLLAVVATAAAPDPRDRFASADACGGALRDLLIATRISSTVLVVGIGIVVGLGAMLLALFRVGSAHDAEDRAFEMAWQTASPKRAPLSVQQTYSLDFDNLSELSQSGALVATTSHGDDRRALVTVQAGRDEALTWLTYSFEEGHVETRVQSADGLQLAYVWIDKKCDCADIRVVDRKGIQQTLFTRPELRGAWLGEWRNGVVPALLAPEQGPHALALIDVTAGTVRVVRHLERAPLGFSLSTDRRFLAFDAPRHKGPGALRDIVVLDVDTGQQHTLRGEDKGWVRPRWSPDGLRLFFLERGRENIAMLAVRMQQGRPVRQPVTLKDSLPVGLVRIPQRRCGGLLEFLARQHLHRAG